MENTEWKTLNGECDQETNEWCRQGDFEEAKTHPIRVSLRVKMWRISFSVQKRYSLKY